MLDTTLNNRYQIRLELGQGGMGTVNQARDIYLERDVAVMVLNRHNLGVVGRLLNVLSNLYRMNPLFENETQELAHV